MKPVRILTVFVFLIVLSLNSSAFLEIHFIDIGQGDASLIISTEGKTMLVDSGNHNSRCYDYLNSIGITSINYFIATHYHADHIGGIDIVVNNGISITDVSYDRGGSYGTNQYDEYVNAVGSLRTTISPGDIIDLGDGVTALCLAVNGEIYNGNQVSTGGDENGKSVTLMITYKDFKCFIAGDLSGYNTAYYVDVETSLASYNKDILDCNVYQVNHHGSRFSSNPYFLANLKPEVSVISCGDGNPYGHPFCETIYRLREIKTVIYQTEAGTGCIGDYFTCEDIVVKVDNTDYYTVSFKELTHYYDLPNSTAPEDTPGDGLVYIPEPKVFPNPCNFNSELRRISFYNLLAGSQVLIYNSSGEIITELIKPNLRGETYWYGKNEDGIKISSGIYFYVISFKNLYRCGKIAVIN